MNRYLICILCLLSLVGCIEMDVVSNSDKPKSEYKCLISFEKDVETRAAQSDVSSILSYGVTCSCYANDKTYATEECGSYFYDLTVDAVDGNTGYYWPGEDFHVSFYVYTPCNNDNITCVSKETDIGIPEYQCVIPCNVSEQVDFMTCNIKDHEGIDLDPVPLTFAHKCANIRFVISNVSDEEVTIKTILLAGMYSQGTLSNDSWQLEGEKNTMDTNPFTYTPNIDIDTDETVDVTGDDGQFIVLPQDVANQTTFLKVITEIGGKENAYEYKLSEQLSLEEGKSYIYNITIDSNNLEITDAEIVDWTKVEKSGEMKIWNQK